ncbi:hypothetical protein [Acinetobacter baumannii]|uniref:hypothetical protein n=1 Tax=Acinetobacter baumannii TaxID=470 RepID=UPI003AF61F5F
MSEFKNMKVKVKDVANLEAICDVLNSLGYKSEYIPSSYVPLCILTYANGLYCAYPYDVHSAVTHTLASLLKMRDEVKAESKEG